MNRPKNRESTSALPMTGAPFFSLLEKIQEIFSAQCAHLTDPVRATGSGTKEEWLSQIQSRLQSLYPGQREEDLILLSRKLYREMAEYSVLTPYLTDPDVEEINVNAWDDIAVTYLDGRTVKSEEVFPGPSYALDCVRRLLHPSGMLLDNCMPMAQGHLPGNTRVTALKCPILDEETGVAVSIRRLHPQKFRLGALLETGMLNEEMFSFLALCIRYGVSTVVSGRTSSGKTTLLGTLLERLPDECRIFTIETGAREIYLSRRDGEGKIQNNVVHTRSRPSEKPSQNLTQETLVSAALRFDPDVIVVGEIRDAEAYAAVEASLTGHTVVSTVHAGPGELTHGRIALLCQRKFPLDMDVVLQQVRQAFPIVVFAHKCEDGHRRVMDITECCSLPGGKYFYRTLWRYVLLGNTRGADGKTVTRGYFEKTANPSQQLLAQLRRSGAPESHLVRWKITQKEEGSPCSDK